ncbi:MAG TPA: helix-turn-helix domain-containing protein [Sphingomonas sp.]|jgi:transcriptional regulator with XRE-family HTH domain
MHNVPFCGNLREDVPLMEKGQPESSIRGEIGQRLRFERKRLGLTQKDFAELGGVGLGAQHRYESGTGSPDTDYLLRIGGSGVDYVWVLTGQRSAGLLSPIHSELLDAFNELGPLDQAVLIRLAASLAGLPVPPLPQMSTGALEEAVLHFLRVSPVEDVDELARELAMSWPTILQAAEGAYEVPASGDRDTPAASPVADGADRPAARQGRRT